MARNEILISAPVEQVFDLISDPRTFGIWVVGSKEIRAADPHWPQAGAAFDHRVGIGPLTLSDSTSVVAVNAPGAIELHARARPLPSARVKLRLAPEAAGTRVVMEESPASRLLSRLIGPLGHRLLWLRNTESLRRLKLLAEGEVPLPTGHLPERPHTYG